MKKSLLLLSLALTSLLFSGCVTVPAPREIVIERVVVVHEYPATIWTFGLGWHGSYYRHGPWRR
jgi:hypothetical protein